MDGPKTKGQEAVDRIVRAVKGRRLLKEVADRGRIAPESLSLDEIKTLCEFAVAHSDCYVRGEER